MDTGDSVRIVPPTSTSPLACVVTSHSVANIGRTDVFRRYGGSLVTRSRVNGENDVDTKAILYRIGRRTATANLHLNIPDTQVPGFEQVIDVNEALYQEVDSRMRKYINVAPDFSKADLSGVIARLSASLAHYSLTGTLTMQQIRGPGVALHLRALNVLSRALPSEGFVYIPFHAALVDCPSAHSALVCAINGAGALAVSEQVIVNPETNAARVIDARDHTLAYGCLTALRMLLSMYEASGCGAVAGLAVTKGVHSVLSVVGHTDEGGYMRDVLRHCRFAVSFGCIFTSKLNSFVHFPVFARMSRVGANVLVDSIALKTAAAVAVCDPLVSIGDREYPTTFAVGDLGESGTDSGEISAADNRSLRVQIAHGCGRFCDSYVAELGRLICNDNGGVDIASRFMKQMFIACAGPREPNRHLTGASAAPFFWVEPTSLYAEDVTTPANVAGYGVLATTNAAVSKHAYPKGKLLYDGTESVGIGCEFRSMRTVPAALHCYMHELDGLANMIPYRMMPDSIAQMGAGHDPENPAEVSAAANMIAGRGLDAYAWRHGSAQIPSPSECMYIGRTVGLRLKMNTFDWNACKIEAEHTVPLTDIRGAVTVDYIAVKPTSMGSGPGMGLPRLLRRIRSRAESALTILNNRTLSGIAAIPTDMTMQFREPGAFDVHYAVEDYEEAGEVQGAGPEPREPRYTEGGAQRVIFVDQASRVRTAQRVGGQALAAEPIPGYVGVGPVPQPEEIAVEPDVVNVEGGEEPQYEEAAPPADEGRGQ